jgi:uncharacterized membrane protein
VSEATNVANHRLITIKLMHTVVWAFFAGSTVMIPVAAWLREFRVAAALAAFVFVEVIVLLVYRWSCPLTAIAARYTNDRASNFDIYLPKWLAQHNKTIFGGLYVAGVVFASLLWINN